MQNEEELNMKAREARLIGPLRSIGKMWLIAFLLMTVFVTGCSDNSSPQWNGDGGGSNAGSSAPSVSFTDPGRGEIGVAVNQKVAAVFSKNMDPTTLTAATFLLTGPGATPIPGTVTCVGQVATFSPTSALAANTVYTATLTTGAKDPSGIALAANFTWTFTTGVGPDTTAPTVTLADPIDGTINVATNRRVAAAFSKNMDPATVTNVTFTLAGPGGTPVAGTVTSVGPVAVFIAASNLANSAVYTATISTGAKDLAGNALAANYTWSFTTGVGPDLTPPTVTLTDPVNSATNVAINQKIAAAFSEGMDPTTINNVNFKLAGPGATPVAGTVTFVGQTATFLPNSNLANSATYTATISTGVKDLAGNALAANYTWSFTTGVGPDLTPPTVTLTDPVNSATNVAINKRIAAAFSEGMDPTTINNVNFKLAGPGATPVTGTVTFVGQTATFLPGSNLANSATYTATMTTGVKDLAGNALAVNYTWSFTTGAAPDTTPPTVTLTDPIDTATNVAINKEIAAAFSKGMDPTTITNVNFTLAGPGATPILGTVTFVGQTATFQPNSILANSATYTATISTGVKDLAGNALAANYTWSFTTGAAPDLTPPTVLLTDPVNTATNIAVNHQVAATFSKGMDPTTINNINFTLAGPGALPVAGTVAMIGQVATFTPTNDLAFNTLYNATITTGVKDLAGNALAANYTWTFTTGAGPDITPPIVTLTDPANGATDVPINKRIAATFNESMDPTTITNLSFTLAGPGGTAVPGIVTYVGLTATFAPASNFAINTPYNATISTDAKDLAGNALAANYTWSFTSGIRTVPQQIPLGAVASFGSFGGGAGITNEGLLTVINGDIGTSGASTMMTGLFDALGVHYTTTPLNAGNVTGTIYTATAPPGSIIASVAALDAQNAYDKLTPALLPGGIVLSNDQLGGRTLLPAIYQSASGSYLITGSDLTLDAQGDPNAVWVFQMATFLTVGGPGAAFPQSVILTNGAQAKNVFWQVGSAATINAGGGGTMVGTIIAQAGVTISTSGSVIISTLNGRALGLAASVTMVNTHMNIPAP